MVDGDPTPDVLRVGPDAHPSLLELSRCYGLQLVHRTLTDALPGSY